MADVCICSLRESCGSRRTNGVKDFVASSLHQGQVLLDFLQITFNGTFAFLMLHRSSLLGHDVETKIGKQPALTTLAPSHQRQL
jgi:hypothetical protein